jgi:hypothetical protein
LGVEDFLAGIVGVAIETLFEILPRPVRDGLCWACDGLLVAGFAIYGLVSLFGPHG